MANKALQDTPLPRFRGEFIPIEFWVTTKGAKKSIENHTMRFVLSTQTTDNSPGIVVLTKTTGNGITQSDDVATLTLEAADTAITALPDSIYDFTCWLIEGGSNRPYVVAKGTLTLEDAAF